MATTPRVIRAPEVLPQVPRKLGAGLLALLPLLLFLVALFSVLK